MATWKRLAWWALPRPGRPFDHAVAPRHLLHHVGHALDVDALLLELLLHGRDHLVARAQVWYHPYSLHVLGMVVGFSLVMRIQIGYQRYWEGISKIKDMYSKWGDACVQAIAFDRVARRTVSRAQPSLDTRLDIHDSVFFLQPAHAPL